MNSFDLLDDIPMPKAPTPQRRWTDTHQERRKKPRLSTTNGHAGFETKCSACGKTFMRSKRPALNRRAYCDTCRASGEPAAQRQRDYRARRVGQ